jgi:hypothetical protein
MKKSFSVLVAVALLFCAMVLPTQTFAAGGKNQNAIGAPTAPGPGADAQGNQAGCVMVLPHNTFAAGGKNQNEIGAPTAPGPGADAQGNQAS